MDLQLQITIRELAGSQALEDKIREKAQKLAKLFDQILKFTSSWTARSAATTRASSTTAGSTLHSRATNRRDPRVRRDPYVSVRDAFDAAKRRLQDHVDRKRGR